MDEQVNSKFTVAETWDGADIEVTNTHFGSWVSVNELQLLSIPSEHNSSAPGLIDGLLSLQSFPPFATST